MEGFKDVIVSQPPAMYSKSTYATSISLENYKGILLCDRPTGLGGSVAGGGGGGGGDGDGGLGGKSFTPSNPTGNPVGLGPSVESQIRREQHEAVRRENLKKHRTQSSQVLSKHRRWLHSFAKQMRQMQVADREREVELAHRAVKLREAEAQRREELKSQPPSPCPDGGCNVTREAGACGPEQPPAARSKKKAAAGPKKPKWAMTEDEALDDELGMNNDLLDFASHLDYDKYVSDYELAEALTVMRDRVQEIARANSWSDEDILLAAKHEDEDDLASTVALSDANGQATAAAANAAPRPQAAAAAAEARAAVPGGAMCHEKSWDASRGRVLKRAISRDALTLAERLLAASPSMQKVYTKQSLARVLQRCALQGDTAVSEAALMAMANADATANKSRAVDVDTKVGADLSAATAIGPQTSEPTVVQIHPGATAGMTGADPYDQPRVLREMQKSKERTQGLPYLYRCPAI